MAIRTHKWIALAIGLSLTVALFAMAACGGDDTTSSTTATAHVTATLAPGQTAGPTAEPTDTSGASISSDDIASQLQALGGDIKQVTGKVTYTNTDTDGTSSTVTLYSKTPNTRYDTTDSDGSSSAYIETSTATYICSSDAAQSDQSCIEEDGASTSGLGLFGSLFSSDIVDALAAAAQAQGIDITKSSETIAGVDADCYSGTDNGSTEKFCFSSDGVMLEELSTDASGTSGLTATAFSSDVSDSDFQPPYPISTIIPAPPTG